MNMNYKSITLIVVFLFICGIVGFSFASGQQDIQTMQPPEEEPPVVTPPTEKPPVVTPPTTPGKKVVSGNSQDLVVVKKKTNETNETNQPPIIIIPPGDGDIISPPTVDQRDGGTILSHKTESGTIPHQIQSSDGVTYYAYCMEPSQKAKVGANLTDYGYSPAVIFYLTMNSDPQDKNSAYTTQLKIWTIVSNGEVDPNSGEAVAIKKSMGISYAQFNQDLQKVKDEISRDYGVGPGQFSGLLEYKPVNIFGYNLLENLIIGFKHLIGIYAPYKPLTESIINNNNTNVNKVGNVTNASVKPQPANTEKCINCGGTGVIMQSYNYMEWIDCGTCGGRGQVYNSIEQMWITCQTCGGTGGHNELITADQMITCPVCGGAGYIKT
jgi:DNA-directed RNA polymerase subunit RPC12/RpoP